MSKKEEIQQSFICPSCGMDMAYDTAGIQVKCAHCGTAENVCPDGDREDRDFAALENNLSLQDWGFPVKVLRCAGCGVKLAVSAEAVLTSCPFCGVSAQIEEIDESPGIRPDTAVPFRIDANEAGSRFIRWISRLKLAPFSMKKQYAAGTLSGVYLPYWAFDTKVKTAYTGEAGSYYHDNDENTHTEDGRTEAHQKSVKKTRWRFVSGMYEKVFRGVIYNDVSIVNEAVIKELEPFKLNELEKFNARHLAGFTAQRYASGPKAIWDRAKKFMSGQILADVSSLVKRGSDVLGPVRICPEYTETQYRLMLLPVWISSYRYKDKTYGIYINGQTGEVTGSSPRSALKILILAAICLAVLVALYFLLLYKK